jgi:hypothetical protein
MLYLLPTELIVIIFSKLNINYVNKFNPNVRINDINKLNKQKLNLMMINKRCKRIMENFFFDVIYFPNHVTIDICNKYNCNTIISPFDKILDDSHMIYFKNVIHLNLQKNKNIIDTGLKLIQNIIYLNLEENENITDNGLKLIPNIIYLNLGCNKNITDSGLKYIPNVTNLILYNSNVTDLGLECISNITFN